MGKLVYSLFVLFLIQFVGVIYLGAGFPGTSLYLAVTGVEEWSANPLIEYIDGILLAVGALTVVVGLYFVKSDFVFYLGIAGILFSFGMAYFELYQIVRSALGTIPSQITLLFFVPFVLPWMFIILDWVRGRD